MKRVVSISLWLVAAWPLACGRPAAELPTRKAQDWTPLERRAAEAAALRWRHPVEQRRVSRGGLAKRIADEYRASFSAAELQGAGRELSVLGLAPPDFDLLSALVELGRGSMLGFYSSLSGTLYLGEPGSGTREVDQIGLLIHELTHALQDQNTVIPLALLGLRENDDVSFALSAVLEGHALHAERRDSVWHDGGARPHVASMLEIEGYLDAFPGIPGVLVENAVAVYPTGLALVRAAELRGGAAELSRLLRDPPMSSEQVLVPAKWFEGPRLDPPRFVELALPELAGCQEIGRNTLGRFSLGIWLEERAGAPRTAADGWGGDRYVLLECADGLRFAWAFEMDSEPAAAALEPLLRAGLGRLAGLSGTVALRRDGVRLLATRGFRQQVRRQLWDGMSSVVFASLEALLQARPEIRSQARRLRADGARAVSSDQRDHAQGRCEHAQSRGRECERELRADVVDQVAAGEHARQDGRVGDR